MKSYGDGVFAVMDTAKGKIIINLEYEKAPLTVINFVALAEGKMDVTKAKPFYDGLTFHRVEPNFVIQGGDPAGNGTGGPGYRFPDEFDTSLKHNSAGILSMANAGAGTNGSQFFITHKATPHLDGRHTVFGHVVAGQDVVNAIQKGDKIISVKIVRQGEKALGFVADQASFDDLKAKITAKASAELNAKRNSDIEKVNKIIPGASKTDSGIFYVITKAGSGPKPNAGQSVSLNYRLTLLSGNVIDETDVRGKPFTFKVGTGMVIAGWDELVLDMTKGEKRKVAIPPELGYGSTAQGQNGEIPANSFLIFEMELISIN
ncbi:MAG: peptidylprolyl isomerase [Termitinemataceae bacterium]|nr:MAG: peptidylprolyl isomerase [Termitinemataceae bacterium]